MVSRDRNFDENVSSYRSKISSSIVEGSERVVVLDVDLEEKEESYLGVNNECMRMDMTSSSNPI